MMPYVRRSSSLQVSDTTHFRHPTGPPRGAGGRSWAAGAADASGTGGAAGAARAESAGGAEGAPGIRAPFEIDEYTRWRLMEGLDDIGLTLRHVEEITAFERSRPAWLPVTS